jgi:hypothetical protein
MADERRVPGAHAVNVDVVLPPFTARSVVIGVNDVEGGVATLVLDGGGGVKISLIINDIKVIKAVCWAAAGRYGAAVPKLLTLMNTFFPAKASK